jgi:hypothetical protein
LSNGDPFSTIASRGDLRATNPVAFGAVDAKLTSFKMVTSASGRWSGSFGSLTGTSLAVCGPTTDDQPVFNFAAFPSVPHYGVPEVFNFSWTLF